MLYLQTRLLLNHTHDLKSQFLKVIFLLNFKNLQNSRASEYYFQFSSVQSLSGVRLSVTP